MGPGSERRRSTRQPSTARAAGDNRLLAYARNFSESGAKLSIVSPCEVRAGRTFRLRFTASREQDLELVARCKVIWSASVGPYCDAGVSFLDLKPEDRDQLRRLSAELGKARRPGQFPQGVKVELLEEYSAESR